MKDLVVLVADKDIEATISGILSRVESLGIRQITRDIYVHSYHDPGCRLDGSSFLRIFLKSHQNAIVVFDRMGCGDELKSRDEIEELVEHSLAINGWEDRATAIVIDPELEKWVWKDSHHVDEILGWSEQQISLREWLCQNYYLEIGCYKPNDPKAALEAALRYVRKARSPSIYSQLAQRVSLRKCDDPAFIKLRSKLQQLFPQN